MPKTMEESLHSVRFPGESPEYRSARDQLLKVELELRSPGTWTRSGRYGVCSTSLPRDGVPTGTLG